MLYLNVTSQQRRMTSVHICVTCATFSYKAAVVRQSKRWYLFLCCPPMSGWTCNSHELCQKTTPRSATVIVLVWQLCFLCISDPPRLRFTWKTISKWREKKHTILSTQMSRFPVCVWLCCKNSLCCFVSVTPVATQWTSLFHCPRPKLSLRPTGVQSYLQ